MYYNNRRLAPVISLLTIVATLVAACGGGSTAAPTSAPAEKVLKIGVEGPFTGPSARTGEEFKGSVQMAFEAEFMGKSISRSTQNIDQLVKMQ